MKTMSACYDLQVSPPTYDFFTFLTQAELFRVGSKEYYDRIDIIFQPGLKDGFREDGLPPDLIERRSMLQRVCVAGARLLPTVGDVVCFHQRTNIDVQFPVGYSPFKPKSHYGCCYQVNGHRCLRATEAARREIKKRYVPKSYVTITLRQSTYWPGRNSNIESWNYVADWLIAHDIDPLFIPDTHDYGSGVFREFSPASWDIDLRLALYENALLNLGVANGPMSLCILSDAPYMMFNIISKDDSPATKAEFLKSHGLEVGGQFGSNGKTVWKEDSAENIINELESWWAQRQEKAA